MVMGKRKKHDHPLPPPWKGGERLGGSEESFMLHLFDSHCHLQDERIVGRIDEIIGRARAAGVEHMLCCGTQEEDWESVAKLAGKYEGIIPAFGLHPWFAVKRSEKWMEKLEKMLMEMPQAAVGEIGLDHVLEKRNDEEQAEVFVAQLKLARKLERPVSIHCRRAWGDMMKILDQQCGLPLGGVIHSFSGTVDLIPRLEQLNVSLSFSGSITYDRNKRGREAAAAVSEKFLLIETDSPDIPPVGVEQGKNEPGNSIKVVNAIAEIRRTGSDHIAGISNANATKIFKMGLPSGRSHRLLGKNPSRPR
jgi:TatD DNase family protein